MKTLWFAVSLSFILITSLGYIAFAQTISVEDVRVSVGRAMETAIVLNGAPRGVSSFVLTLRLAGDMGHVEKVVLSAAFNKIAVVNVAEDGDSVTISANDADDLIRSGARDVELARVQLRGTFKGISKIQIASNKITDDTGSSMNVAIQNGALNVTNGPGEPSVVAGSDGMLVDETVATPIILTETPPGGLSGFSLTVTLSENVAKIQEVQFVAFDGETKIDISQNGRSVSFSAKDLNDAVQAGDVGIVLARILFEGFLPGSSDVEVTVKSLQSESGATLRVPSIKGSLNVSALANEPPFFASNLPQKNVLLEVNRPFISINILDELDDVNPSTIFMKVTDSAQAMMFDRFSVGTLWDGKTFSVNLQMADLSLADGKVAVEVSAQDGSGNLGTTSWVFNVNTGGSTSPPSDMTIAQVIAGGDGVISDAEILKAIQLWIVRQEVPGTGGQRIDDAEILVAIALWISGSTVPGTNETISDAKIRELIQMWISGTPIQ